MTIYHTLFVIVYLLGVAGYLARAYSGYIRGHIEATEAKVNADDLASFRRGVATMALITSLLWPFVMPYIAIKRALR